MLFGVKPGVAMLYHDAPPGCVVGALGDTSSGASAVSAAPGASAVPAARAGGPSSTHQEVPEEVAAPGDASSGASAVPPAPAVGASSTHQEIAEEVGDDICEKALED